MISRAARQISRNSIKSKSITYNTTSLSHFQRNALLTKSQMIPITNNNNNNDPTNTQKSWMGSNALTSLPSLPSLSQSVSQSLSSMTQTITSLTGMTRGGTEKQSRIMERVWKKRKDRLQKATAGILQKFESTNNKIAAVEIYIRNTGSFDDAEDNAQKEVHIALRGIAHTVVVLKMKDSSCYLLDRVVEGIRLSELKLNDDGKSIEKCNKFKPEEMVKLGCYKNDKIKHLSTKKIASWVQEQSKTKYHVLLNSCVHFSFYFYQEFFLKNIFRLKRE